MSHEENTTVKEKVAQSDGMPEVAVNQDRRPLVLIILALVLVIISLSYLYHHSVRNSTTVKPIDENYTVPNSVPAQNNSPIKTSAGTNTVMEKNTSVAPVKPTLTPEQVAFLQEKKKELRDRLSSPLMLVNNNSSHATNNSQTGSVNTGKSDDPNTQFMDQVSAQTTDTLHARRLGNLHYLITEGTFIHADLESAIDSDLPGHIRAIVREPLYSDDGAQILIPSGSKLLGEYKSGVLQGQSRIFVVWTRIVMGELSINLGSPGVDNLGTAGFGADWIDYHFMQRFGTTALVSLMGAGVSNLGVNNGSQYNASQEYRIALAQSLSQSATSLLSMTINIPPTLYKNQGAHIMVYVAHDLSFESAMKQNAHKINVF